MSKDLGPMPRISPDPYAGRYPWPKTAADMIPARQATLAALEGQEFPCPNGHGPMQPRPLGQQTYEQLFCGLWWDCDGGDYRKCASSTSVPSRELAVHLGEPHRTDEGGWEKHDGAAWVAITDDEAEAFWAERQAWREARDRQMYGPKRKRQRQSAAHRNATAPLRTTPGGQLRIDKAKATS